ncbi:MAG: hypothetical protein ACLP56_11175 [Candidatus Sulfotelmatobacter sp.]
MTNPQMLRRFGQASSRINKEKFPMDLMVERYVALLNPGASVMWAFWTASPGTHVVSAQKQ